MNPVVRVGDRRIGSGEKTFVVFELGVCHEQNVELAEHFIEVAKKTGADAVKVEAFQADELVIDRSITHEYGTVSGVKRENYYQLSKRLELTFDDYARLKNKADKEGILFFSTVHNKRCVDFMESLGVCAFKLASPDIINYPLIRYVSAKGLPVFADTGGAFMSEIEKAVTEYRSAGLENLILMHNPSGYPAPPEKTDLRMIPSMKKLLDIPVGLSCHTPGFDMTVAATAIGADVIEKPISRNRHLQSPEHIFSFLDTEALEFISRIRTTEISLGKKRRDVVMEKSLPRFIGRRGIYAAKDLTAGKIISEEDVVFAKPWRGISVEFVDEVIGRKVNREINKHQPIEWRSLE